jgi:hypothetical protein
MCNGYREYSIWGKDGQSAMLITRHGTLTRRSQAPLVAWVIITVTVDQPARYITSVGRIPKTLTLARVELLFLTEIMYALPSF